MEANIHTPERLEGESFKAYKNRRWTSRKINKEARKGTMFHDPLNNKRKRLGGGTYENRDKAERRAKVRLCGGIRQYKKAMRAYLLSAG